MSFIHGPVFNKVVFPFSLLSTLCGTVYLLRERRGGKQCPSKDRVDGKVFVVTGANSGIGYETADDLARRGGTVIMGCRHIGKCEEAARQIRANAQSKSVVCRFLDLANLDSVTDFANELKGEVDHVDVLVNNAGVMKPRPPKTTFHSDDGFERQFAINHLGHFLLTNLLLDKLTNGEEPGRVINVTCPGYKAGTLDLEDVEKEELKGETRLSELYYQSKLANVLFTQELHAKGQNEYGGKVTSNSVDPGVASTNINKYSVVPLYASAVHLYKPIKYFLMKTARQGAQTSIFLSVDKALNDKSGKHYDDCEPVDDTCNICDVELAKTLWDMSEKWTDLKRRQGSVAPQMEQETNSDNNKVTATV